MNTAPESPALRSARRFFIAGACLFICSILLVCWAVYWQKAPLTNSAADPPPRRVVTATHDAPPGAVRPRSAPPDESAAVEKARMEHLRKMEKDKKKVLANDKLINMDGKVNEKLAEELQLTRKQFAALEEAWRQLRADITAAARSRLRDETTEIDKEWGRTKYAIMPYPDEGRKSLERFEAAVKEALGDDLGNKTLEGFPAQKYFGEMGRNRLALTFEESGNETTDLHVAVSAQEIDENGVTVLTMKGEISVTRKYFPDLFEVK